MSDPAPTSDTATKQSILCFAPLAGWWLHAAYEVAIAHNLKWRGHDVTYVTCDGLFSECDLHWLSTTGPRPADACAKCQLRVTQSLDAAGIQPLWMGQFLSAADRTDAQRMVAEIPDAHLLDATFDGLSIASWVKSSVHTYFRVNTLDLANPGHVRVLRSYLAAGILTSRLFCRMLDELEPDVVLLFNGRMAATRVAFELARARGVRVVCHERGLRRERLRVWENAHCLSLDVYEALWAKWGMVPLSDPEVDEVTEWLLDRTRGLNVSWPSFSERGSLGGLARFVEARKGRKLWVLFTSSTDEIIAGGEFKTVFGTQYEWILETVEYARSHPEVSLVVRVHPNSGGKRSHGRNSDDLGFFASLGENLPENVFLVMPDDPVSTYALIDRCDLGLAFCSTVSLELACRGKPVLAAARSVFTPCPSVNLIGSRQEYSTLLTGFAGSTSTREDARRVATAAFRFASAYICRWDRPFPVVHLAGMHEAALAIHSTEELKPGRYACLDQMAEIVLATRSSVPSPAGRDPVPAEAESAAIERALATLQAGVYPPHPARLTVVVWCDSAETRLGLCLRSLAQQRLRGLSVVVVSDSTNSESAISAACSEHGEGLSLTRVVLDGRGCPARAWNVGIEQAASEWVMPLYADDRLHGEYLDKLMRVAISGETVDIIYANVAIYTATGLSAMRADPFQLSTLKTRCGVSHASMFRASLWKSLDGFSEQAAGAVEWDFWLRCCAAGAVARYLPSVGPILAPRMSYRFTGEAPRPARAIARMKLHLPQLFPQPDRERAQAVLKEPIRAVDGHAMLRVVLAAPEDLSDLRLTLESLAAQTCKQFEVVLVAQPGQRDHLQIAREIFGSEGPAFVRVVGTATGNRLIDLNAAIRSASAKYVATVRGGDYLHPGFFRTAIEMLEGDPHLGLLYCDLQCWGAEERVARSPDPDLVAMAAKLQSPGEGHVIRRTSWLSVGGFKPELGTWAELEFALALGRRRIALARIPQPLVYRGKTDQVAPEADGAQIAIARLVSLHANYFPAGAVTAARQLLAKSGVLRAAAVPQPSMQR